MALAKWEIVNAWLLIGWEDGGESAVPLTILRDHCPCAVCAGEKDALGNRYRPPKALKTAASYELRDLRSVGHYGLQPVWGDGHDTGIFQFDVLKRLSQ